MLFKKQRSNKRKVKELIQKLVKQIKDKIKGYQRRKISAINPVQKRIIAK